MRWLPKIGWIELSTEDALGFEFEFEQLARWRWRVFRIEWLDFGLMLSCECLGERE